ncbi:FecR family protein [Parabacteroides sp. Marseille-P3160]|uniref:FecR family protein n=1 Tax=Parabacteroides sp. Marseille-P3160 TaxID=1917887 RepID=UPI0009BB92BA|nr:FecR domain-containing protein [Parabacteroides sp. Marseille-P3160]
MNLKSRYSYFASLFDRNKTEEEKRFESKEEEEEFKKLEFLWKNCSPEKIDCEQILARTAWKIKEDSRQKKRQFLIRTASVAASFLFILSLGYYFFHASSGKQPDLKEIAATFATESDDIKEITLITAQNKYQVNENASIKYSAEGDVMVDSEPIEKEKVAKEEYNQIIVPKGRRTQVVLSDGSKIWINSGSKLIYPSLFNDKKREIFIEGEAYFEVSPDKSRPFVVNTSGFAVTVLGTSFNVSAYKYEETATVVLVKGSVEVKDGNNMKMKIVPNELLSIRKTGITGKTYVNAEEYISWVDGILILKGETLSVLSGKLELYYGRTIRCDASVANQKIYGKLDMRDDLLDVLDYIKTIIPIQIKEENNEIALSKE